MAMKYTSERIESARGEVIDAEQRIVRQRRRVEKMLIERDPAVDAQAKLLIMEESLCAMRRFVQILERDLQSDFSLHKRQVSKRLSAASPEDDDVSRLADEFVQLATRDILEPDHGLSILNALSINKLR